MNLLCNTGDGIIAEATYDKLWGTGVPLHHDNALNQNDWANVGILGEILMKIRDDNYEQNITGRNATPEAQIDTSGCNRPKWNKLKGK